MPQSAGAWDFHHFDPGQDWRNWRQHAWRENLSIVPGTNGAYCWFSAWLSSYWLIFSVFSFDKGPIFLIGHVMLRCSQSIMWRSMVAISIFFVVYAILPSLNFCWSSSCVIYAGPGLQDNQGTLVKLQRLMIIMILLFLLLAWSVLHVEGAQMVIMRPKHCCFFAIPHKKAQVDFLHQNSNLTTHSTDEYTKNCHIALHLATSTTKLYSCVILYHLVHLFAYSRVFCFGLSGEVL